MTSKPPEYPKHDSLTSQTSSTEHEPTQSLEQLLLQDEDYQREHLESQLDDDMLTPVARITLNFQEARLTESQRTQLHTTRSPSQRPYEQRRSSFPPPPAHDQAIAHGLYGSRQLPAQDAWTRRELNGYQLTHQSPSQAGFTPAIIPQPNYEQSAHTPARNLAQYDSMSSMDMDSELTRIDDNPAHISRDSYSDARMLADTLDAPTTSHDLHAHMTECFSLADYSGALHAAELILGMQSDNSQAQHYARVSKQHIRDMHAQKIGGLNVLLYCTKPSSHMVWAELGGNARLVAAHFSQANRANEICERMSLEEHEFYLLVSELYALELLSGILPP